MWRPSQWSTANTPSNTPPPQNPLPRNYAPSPLGRRISSSGNRPTLANRVSSISLLSTPNASTTSLPGALKQLQEQPEEPAMGYRKAVSQSRPAGVKDPLDVLEGILGAPVNGAEQPEEPIEPPEAKEAEGIDFGGLSLEEFVETEGEDEGVKGGRVFSEKSAEEYEKEKDRFQDLHRSIKACDEVLKSVESYLSAFQTDLGVVSAEIETLQNRSTTLNKRLDNRKEVEKLLGPIVEDIVLPPNDVRRIIEGDVNENWVKTLQETDRRMKAIETKDPMKVKAVQEIKPELERIISKAVERVRDFFVSRIKAIRMPGTNAQTIQQAGFIRYRELFQFLANRHPEVAEEIGQAYINTMRWYYLSHFQRYVRALEKVKVHILDKTDTLGAEDTRKGGNVLLPTLKSASVPSHDPFNIGRRIELLKNRTAPILAAYQIDDDPKAIHYAEYPFRHLSAALLENASSEYSFITEFFTHKTYDQAQSIFNQVFEPTFALSQTYIKTLIDSTMDAFAMLICVRLNQDAAFEMQKRRCPGADGYINGINMLLWPRFQKVMDAHCESLRKRQGNTSEKLGLAPHPLTQRFASFVHGILVLSSDAGDDEPVSNSLLRLRADYEACLTRISRASVPEGKKREGFLGNNYALVVAILGDTEGKLATEWKTHFETLRKAFQE